jgi:uncharacterized protein (TIGR02145 family)
MKKLHTLLALVITLVTFAQAPQGFNYQATVRNSSGAVIANQNVNFKFNIMLNSATSLPVFSETHLAPTDDLGQVNLVIGQGTATTGSFSTINWGTGNYYLGIELNTGAGYVAMGTTQLLSVPYALYANSSGNAQAATPTLASVLAVNNSANNTKITNLANPTNAQDAVTKSYLDNLDNSKWLKNGNNVFYNGGNVGIGTNNPTFGLEVVSNSLEARRGIMMSHYTDNNNASQIMLSKYRGSFAQPQNVQNTDYTGTLIFTAYNGQTSSTELPRGSALIGSRISGNITSNSVPQDLYFATGNSTTQTDPYQQNTVRMVVSNNGNVGIGTTTPARTLHVNSVMRLEPIQSSPTNPGKGDMYFDSTLNKLRVYDGSVWQNSSDSQATTPNLASVLAVNNGANNLQIKNLANPTAAQDAVTKVYTDAINTQLQTQITALQAQIELLQNYNMLNSVTIIGQQTWASINLNVTTYRDGTPIPQVTDPTQWANLTTGAWCYYNNDPTNGNVYGKLYNWYAVAGIHDNDPNTPNKILAPNGWHIPSDTEWTILTDFLGGLTSAGGKMKSTDSTLWLSPNTGATNQSGFSGLPGGFRLSDGTFNYIRNGGDWWSTTENGATNVWYRLLDTNNSWVGRVSDSKIRGLSVRCIRD